MYVTSITKTSVRGLSVDFDRSKYLFKTISKVSVVTDMTDSY